MIKTLTFAVMHFSIAFAVAYALTGDLVVGGAVAMVEPLVNTLGYHVHERIWRRLQQRRAAGQPHGMAVRAAERQTRGATGDPPRKRRPNWQPCQPEAALSA